VDALEDLSSKVAFITGGSSGIGLAVALAFARQGARVAIAAMDSIRGEEALDQIRSLGAQALFVKTNVSQADEVRAAVDKTVRTFGRLDFAFNNAAIYQSGAFALTAEFSEKDFDCTMAVNCKGVWLCMKHEIEQMLSQRPSGGAIVNTASLTGFGGAACASIYSASKAAVLALTKSAAQEYAPMKIRINAIVPGVFQTPMFEQSLARKSNDDAWVRDALLKNYREQIALGRIGEPEEAAEAVLWLCSEASSYIIGHSLVVDGGRSALFR
jgi:NAD(P)-dependent dehydrogenase (short-subunit alcohol dehydrogenase family)